MNSTVFPKPRGVENYRYSTSHIRNCLKVSESELESRPCGRGKTNTQGGTPRPTETPHTALRLFWSPGPKGHIPGLEDTSQGSKPVGVSLRQRGQKEECPRWGKRRYSAFEDQTHIKHRMLGWAWTFQIPEGIAQQMAVSPWQRMPIARTPQGFPRG